MKKRIKSRRNESRPVFVVGSPRSGTSILTWCLGQHPNILPLAESAWMGDFAIDIGIRYSIGSARGALSHLSSVGVQENKFFAHFGDAVHRLILSHRKRIEENLDQVGFYGFRDVRPGFKTERAKGEPKSRWADGTPEYSFHICGLRKLFPKALFIHLVRDVSSVVPSMMNFYRVGGKHLVASEQEAYEYWLRAARACVQAEKAYGSKVIYRLRYSDLITNSKPAMRAVLNFLGEPYAAACLEPLREKINSSRISGNFRIGEACANPSLVEEAELLSAELRQKPPRFNPSVLVAQKMEVNFAQRVQYFANLDLEYRRAQTIVSQLQKEFEERTAWALKCSEELAERDAIILRLQKEFEERTAWALSLNKEVEERTAWALSLKEELRARDALIRQLRITKKNVGQPSNNCPSAPQQKGV